MQETFFTSKQAAKITGCTLRQLQYWREKGVVVSRGDNRLKRLAGLDFPPLESSKNRRLLTGLLRMNF
jgi:hypothetical protein